MSKPEPESYSLDGFSIEYNPNGYIIKTVTEIARYEFKARVVWVLGETTMTHDEIEYFDTFGEAKKWVEDNIGFKMA